MTSIATTAIATALLLLASTAQGQGGNQESRTPKAIIIGIDGLRADAMRAANAPTLHRLASEGAATDQCLANAHTVSGPGWSTILCGVWDDKHRVTNNEFTAPEYARHPSIFTLAHRVRANVRTGSFVSWLPIDEKIIGVEPIDVRAARAGDQDGDAFVTAQAAEALRTADVDLAFFYLGDVDEAGHAHGFHKDVPEYRAAIERADEQITRVLEALRSRPDAPREDWLVVITTDHGGTADGKHGRDITEHRRVPLILHGIGVERGVVPCNVGQVDIVPTVLTYIGLALDPKWELDGRAIALRSRVAQFNLNLLVNGGAETQTLRDDHPADPQGAAPDVCVAGWEDVTPATLLRYDANGALVGSSAGVPAHGRNYFDGGTAPQSHLLQRIDLRHLTAQISSNRATFDAGGWFGASGKDAGVAWLELRFLDPNGGVLSTFASEAVTSGELGDGAARLLKRNVAARVPRLSTSVEIVLRFERGSGSGHPCADELWFVAREKEAPERPAADQRRPPVRQPGREPVRRQR